MNEIVFPAAILQPPFFNLEADDAVNYGAIGGVIGHEISHGFDDQGRRSDGDGNLRDWWTAEDAGRVRERTAGWWSSTAATSPLEGLCMNGRVALGENIADLSGLTVAYRAYRLSLGGQERRSSTASPATSASSSAGRRSGASTTARRRCGAAMMIWPGSMRPRAASMAANAMSAPTGTTSPAKTAVSSRHATNRTPGPRAISWLDSQ
jgi:predicted metalloendopeptidase